MCSGIPIKLLNFSDLTKFLVLNFHAKHQIFNGLNIWLLGAVNKFSKNNRSIVFKIQPKMRDRRYMKNGMSATPRSWERNAFIFELNDSAEAFVTNLLK